MRHDKLDTAPANACEFLESNWLPTIEPHVTASKKTMRWYADPVRAEAHVAHAQTTVRSNTAS